MLRESRLYLMIKLADFRQENKDKRLRVAKYYKHDYIALSLVKNLIITTFTWLLLFGIYALTHLELILANLSEMKFGPLLIMMLISYAMMLGVYSIITYTTARIRHERAQAKVKEYDRKLRLLERILDEEEQDQYDLFGGK